MTSRGTRIETRTQLEGCCISSGKMTVILTWIPAVEVVSGQTEDIFEGKDDGMHWWIEC